jgi:hypothetical protein
VSARRAWQRFEVAFTGPFLTGQPLQVRISDYSRFQAELSDQLNRTSEGWDYKGIKWRGVESYGSGGGYTTLVPLVLIRREGDILKRRLSELQRTRPDSEQMWLHHAIEGWEWKLRTVKIELYDLGVGVITGVYDVRAPLWLSVEATRRVAESVARLTVPLTDDHSPVAVSYDLLARETVALFSEGVGRCEGVETREPWLTSLLQGLAPAEPEGGGGEVGQLADAGAPGNEWGRLLWLHPVFLLTAGPKASMWRMRQLSRPCEATFSQPIEYWHGLFVPGIDSSVVVLRRNGEGEKRPPMGLTLLMWAYYGLFMEMDRGLLAMLDSDRWQTPNSLAELEDEARRIFSIYMRVREARSRLDSALTDLAGGQLSMWNAISDVQKFDELVEAVEGKVETLRHIADRRVQEATAARARRTGNILSGLTALTVVTVVIALISNFIGTRSDTLGHIGVRLVAITAAFLLALTLYREAQREIARKRRER